MKLLFRLLLLGTVLSGCPGWGLRQNLPRHDLRVSGFYLKDAQDPYYMLNLFGGRDVKAFFNEGDTANIDGVLYKNVFYARLDPKNFRNGYDNLNYNFGLIADLYVRGSFERKQVPGEGTKQYLVLENVVGIE